MVEFPQGILDFWYFSPSAPGIIFFLTLLLYLPLHIAFILWSFLPGRVGDVGDDVLYWGGVLLWILLGLLLGPVIIVLVIYVVFIMGFLAAEIWRLVFG